MACPQTQRQLEHFWGFDRRIGLEAAADWGDFSVRAEYIRAVFDFADPSPAIAAAGYYAEFAKFFGRMAGCCQKPDRPHTALMQR
jgi:phosphate-selective porin